MQARNGTNALAGVVRGINAAHGTAFVLLERFAAGEQGAYRLCDATGPEWVLKWSPGSRDVHTVERMVWLLYRLRAAGHRVPRIAASGVLDGDRKGRYVVQERLPGAPLTSLDGTLLEQILTLNDLQAGLAAGLPPTRRSRRSGWPALPIGDVLRGGDGYCLLAPMQRHSARTARLLASLQEFVAAQEAEVTRVVTTDDVVHFDLNPANILAQGARVTGIIDWDGARAGDRASSPGPGANPDASRTVRSGRRLH
jgi:Ser/Thr protein kinase RdoA (MazF antagonist)